MLERNTKKSTLLYIDTAHEFSQILSRLLEREGYRILFYSHLSHALSSPIRSNIDLCLCEFKIFKHALLTNSNDYPIFNTVPVIVLANHFTDQDKRYLAQSPVLDFFEKSDPFVNVLHKIKTALQHAAN